MFKKDIEKAFTEKVQEYLMKGYRFYSDGMRGSQGELAKVVLTDDNELIIIYLDEDHRPLEVIHNSVILFVEKQPCTKHTVWLHEGDIIEKTVWYDLSGGYGEYYLDSNDPKMNDIIAIKCYRRNLRHNSKNSKNVEFTSDKAKKIILPLIKKQPKCKSKTINDIVSISRRYNSSNSSYYVVQFKDYKTLCL